ncbi:hypothetical protein CCR97_13835 [Rhodoplanes elegans]|uniref:Uncharacterized protein n=1 Tax=Rhodoplanes elegans TaxID=29408 RepID=A0A327KX10_9BRAD|nr:hypothetical protein [Rhodoplanes elegans]MBK5959278.1 hypothetical protein [Rhodoplanes elegans]RAI42203.1 hypothetical protein CH338_00825 [Rhodoplanes elegans]
MLTVIRRGFLSDWKQPSVEAEVRATIAVVFQATADGHALNASLRVRLASASDQIEDAAKALTK